jgi:ankyrin repeat protein
MITAPEHNKTAKLLDNFCKSGELDAMKYFVKVFKISKSYFNKDHLITACFRGHLNVVMYLHDEIGLTSIDKDTALNYACNGGYIDLVKYLVEVFGLTLNEYRAFKANIVYIVIYARSMEILEYLKKKLNLNADDARLNENEALYESCSMGCFDFVKYLIEDFGLDGDDVASSEYLPLRIACSDGHLDIVKYLVNTFNLQIESFRMGHNYTLINTCIGGHFDSVKYLFENGYDLTDVQFESCKPFYCACSYGHLDIVKYFVDKVVLTLEKSGEELMTKYLKKINDYYENISTDVSCEIEKDNLNNMLDIDMLEI